MSHISLPNLLCQQHRVRWPPIASAINAQILVCALLCGADSLLQAEHTVTALRAPLRSFIIEQRAAAPCACHRSHRQ